jgi:hypothetical protein
VARRLETTDREVLRVTLEVGYESEAAFNRAFKWQFGVAEGLSNSEHGPGHGTLHTDNHTTSPLPCHPDAGWISLPRHADPRWHPLYAVILDLGQAKVVIVRPATSSHTAGLHSTESPRKS